MRGRRTCEHTHTIGAIELNVHHPLLVSLLYVVCLRMGQRNAARAHSCCHTCSLSDRPSGRGAHVGHEPQATSQCRRRQHSEIARPAAAGCMCCHLGASLLLLLAPRAHASLRQSKQRPQGSIPAEARGMPTERQEGPIRVSTSGASPSRASPSRVNACLAGARGSIFTHA